MGLGKIYSALLLFIGGVFCSANIMAQSSDSTFTDIDFVRKSNVWSFSDNATGLKYFSIPQISRAQLFFSKADGDFRNYHQSSNSYQYGISAQSIYRINPKIVFSGEVDYTNFKGKQMGGSSFIDPYMNAIDITEIDVADIGTKQLENYHLKGAVSAQLNSRFTIAGKIDYQTANFAKMKDIRHVNKLLDMNLSIGAAYQLSEAIEFGANYTYDRRIESVIFRVFGNRVKVFTSLVNLGSFYGRSETFSDYGYTADGSLRPLTNFTQGGALQLNVKLNDRIRWFNEFGYSKINGFFGEEGTSDIKFTDHSADQFAYKSMLSVVGNRDQHFISVNASYQNLINLENVHRRETSTGGNSVIIYYGTSEVLDQQLLSANLAYSFFRDVQANNPKWAFNATVDYFRRQQTTNLYPFYRDQTINSYQANVNVKRNIVKAKEMYSFAIGLGYGSGSGIAKYDGLYVAPSSSQAAPTSMDLYLYQEFEYFTKPRIMADVSLQYTKKMKQNIAPYAKLSYNYTKAFDTQFLGGSFGIAGVSLGSNF